MIRIRLIPIICAWLLLLPFVSISQQYSYVNYNMKDGLAGPVVYCMAQDQEGFIWLGTETGLSRFDGSRFVNYTTNDGLPDNEIIRLFADSKNRLWVIPFKNQLCYYKDGRFHTAANDSLVRRLALHEDIVGIVENSSGEIAIAERFHITIIRSNDEVWKYDKVNSDGSFIGNVGLNFDGSFLFLTAKLGPNHNLMKISGGELVTLDSVFIDRMSTVNLAQLGAHLRIISNRDSLLFATPGEQFATTVPEGMINLRCLNDSLVAVTAISKTYTYNYRRRTIDRIFFTGENITSAMEDREGNLWFSSMGNGVYRLPSIHFTSRIFEFNGKKLPVYSLQKKGDILFAGTSNDLLWSISSKHDRVEKRVVFRRFNEGRINTIDTLRDGRLLVGSDNGLLIESENHFRFIVPGNAMKSVYVHEDTILMAFNAGARAVSEFSVKPFIGFFAIRSTAICRQLNTIFIGTLQGLYSGYFYGPQVYMGKIHPAFNSRVSALKQAADGTLWVGTYGYGAVAYRNGKVSAVLTIDSGLTSNIVRTLYVTENAIWIGTDKVLNKVEFINGDYKITRFTAADGLMSDMINAVLVDGKTVHVGTPSGLTSFEEDMVFTRSMCELQLTGIGSARQRTISDTGHLYFDHYDRDIRFEFTGISFKSAGEITYWHRLKALDPNWHASTDNFLNYPALPSGDYELELQAKNKFGVPSKIIHLRFSVEHLLWEKTWFRMASVIVLAGLVWFFIAYRSRKIRKQEQEKLGTSRKMAELEQMALRAQMNPHFIFNSLNSIQHYVFRKDAKSANRFLTAFSRLIRTTMEISGKNSISLEEEIKYLSTYLELEKRRFDDKFDFHITLDDSLDPLACYIPPMILQPYIENSIRHGLRYLPHNNGILKLDFSMMHNCVVCVVEDNGIGREASRQLKGQHIIEYQSKGMTPTARRIEMMNKSLNDPILIGITDLYDGNEAAGTRVVIRIPLQEM